MKKRAPRVQTDQCTSSDEHSTSRPGSNGTWQLIAWKAYELYEQRGRKDGHALEDWLKAEAIIRGVPS